MGKIDDLTTSILAIYGSIIASVTFGWNLFRDFRDRAKLSISARVRRITIGANGQPYAVAPDLPVEGATNELFVVMTVVNVGRRPMYWEGWGARYTKPAGKKKGLWVGPRDLPKMLQEREAHREFTELADFQIGAVKSIYIWDASGKEWRLSWLQMRRLRKEAEEALREMQ
jgi:hypothetical protein